MGRKARPFQTTFTSGELDPKLRARMDVTHYYNGADKLRNVVAFPQGGTSRRPGKSYKATILNTLSEIDLSGATVTAPNDSGSTVGNATDGDPSTELTTSAAGTTDPFVIVHVDLGSALAVQFFDVRGLRLYDTAAGGLNAPSTEVKVQYSLNNIAWFDFGPNYLSVPLTDIQRRRAQSDGTGQTARYWRIVREGSTDLGTYGFALDEILMWSEDAAASVIRMPDFRFSDTQHYQLVVTDRNIRVYLDGAFAGDASIPHTSAQLAETLWLQSQDTVILFNADVQTHRIQRQGGDGEWDDVEVPLTNIPKHEYSKNDSQPAGTLTPSAIENIANLTRSAGTWSDPGDIGTYVVGNSGRARITEIVSSTVARAAVIDPFFDTSAIATGEWTHEQGWEDVISATRGWPRCGMLHGGGLWIGGFKSLPNAFIRSTLDDPFDLDLGRGLDDEAIFGQIDHPKEVPEIRFINSGRHLHFFTSAGEYFTLPENEAITPDNIDVRLTTSIGIKGPGIVALNIEGAVLFVQGTGAGVMEMVFTDLEQKYETNPISLLSPHLIESPTNLGFRKPENEDEGNLVFVTNGADASNPRGFDGTLAVLRTLRKQEVAAWQLWETDGEYKAVGVDAPDVYFAIARTVGGVTVNYLERMDADAKLDSSVKYTTSTGPTLLPATVLGGLDHLEGRSVMARVDGTVAGPFTVAGGQITLTDEAEETAEVGLSFPDVKQNEVARRLAAGDTPSSVYTQVYGSPAVTAGFGDEIWIRDMPVTFETAQGNPVGQKKRASEVTTMIRETEGFFLGANMLPPREVILRRLGSELLDQPLPQVTDDIVIRGIRGYSKFGQVEIVQRNPVAGTWLGIAKKVNF